VVNSVVVRQPHIRQVKLKVQIIEIDRSKIDSLVSTSSARVRIQRVSNRTVSLGRKLYARHNRTATTPDLSSNPLNLLFYNSGLNIGLTLQDLQNKQSRANSCRAHHYYAQRTEGVVSSGGEFPFPVVQGSSGGLTSITIQFRPYGVKLDFTPDRQ
jgi:pilus assembly protein CpaC